LTSHETDMSGLGRSINEDELQAYVDNRLDMARHSAIDLYLHERPDEAGRVEAYRKQRALLRAAATPFGTRPLPAKLSVDRIAERFGRQQTRWRMAAAVALGSVLGGIAGWVLGSPMTSDRTERAIALLEREALATHAVYSADRHHPIEVSAAESDHLRQWLSSRLNRAVAPPDLTALGYQLLGGRLLATERGGSAALFMYENSSGRRRSIVVRPLSPDLRALRFEMAQGATNGCGWIWKGLGIAVIAALPDDELDRITEQVRAEIAKPTG
jgi:anti-sigma factor RsiW